MILKSGTRLGAYEIVSPIGAGGMGEVYRARDRRLGREVAIKILPSAVGNDPERLSRFESEARAASALNHPNIVTVHEVGRDSDVSWIAMELVEGKSLRSLLMAGPLSVRKLLALAPQIADGLAKAHSAGIVHRDLKPENVMVSSDGFVKIVDFGLAKLAPIGAQASLAPTDALPETLTGKILGTISYMSPEQATGREVDYRSDQFSLASILYEMVTGRTAFARQSVVDTLSAIVHDNPEPIAPETPIPPALRWTIERCHSKDGEERYASTKDLARDLTAIRDRWLQNPDKGSAPLSNAPSRRSVAFWAILAAAVALAIAAAGAFAGRSAHPTRSLRATLEIPWADFGGLALSPDGSRLAFVAPSPENGQMIWIRSMDSAEPIPVAGTRGARLPFWSPDGRYLAYFAQRKLKRIEAGGGVARVLADAPGAFGGSWSREGWILFAPNYRGGLFRVRAEGGTTEPVTSLDPARHDSSHRWPHFLPDGRHFLAVLGTSVEGEGKTSLVVGSIGDPALRVVLSDAWNALYMPPGYVVFARGARLLAQPFDLRELAASGEPHPVGHQDVAFRKRWAYAEFTGAAEGSTLAYRPAFVERSEVVWVDRAGKTVGRVAENGGYGRVRLSPSGHRVAVVESDPETTDGDVWVIDATRGNSTRLTFHPAFYGNLAWAPDESAVFFESDRGETQDIFRKTTKIAGDEEVVVHSDLWKSLGDVSPDGRHLLFNPRGLLTDVDLWAMDLKDGRKAFPLLVTPFDEHAGRFSPDGKWIAYVSYETGQPEVYVRGFPESGEKLEISHGRGVEPRWSRDGKELYFQAPGGKIMAAEVHAGPAFETGSVKLLFDVPDLIDLDCCSADGQQFLIVKPVESRRPAGVTLVTGWTGAGSN